MRHAWGRRQVGMMDQPVVPTAVSSWVRAVGSCDPITSGHGNRWGSGSPSGDSTKKAKLQSAWLSHFCTGTSSMTLSLRAPLVHRFLFTGSYSPVLIRRFLFANVRHQGHEACSLDRQSDGVLAGCRATRFSTTHNATMSVDQFLQEVNVFVVHIHGTWPLAIYVQRIAFCSTSTCFCFCSSSGSSANHVQS